MPRLSELQAKPVKALFMANSGFGKTGALASLANAGYKLIVFDFDNGARILSQYLSTIDSTNRVWVRTHTDKFASDGISIEPDGPPTAYSDFISDLRGFEEDDGSKFGAIHTWDENTIAVVDSLTMLSQAAMRYRLMINVGATNNTDRWMHPYPADFGEAQNLVRKVVELFYSDIIKCNVIFNTHVRYIGGGGIQSIVDKKTGAITQRETDSEISGQAQPTTIGRALGSEICRYFNTVISGEIEGGGLSAERFIVTRDLPQFPLKSERPIDLDQRLPIDTGLAELFRVLRGTEPE